MKVRIVFIISLANASPVTPTFTKNPVTPVSGSLIEIAEITKKMTRTSRITDFFINIVGSFYLSLFFFFFLFFFLNLYDKSMLA